MGLGYFWPQTCCRALQFNELRRHFDSDLGQSHFLRTSLAPAFGTLLLRGEACAALTRSQNALVSRAIAKASGDPPQARDNPADRTVRHVCSHLSARHANQ